MRGFRQLAFKMLIQPPQASGVNDKGTDRRRDAPQGNVQRLGLNTARLKHKVMHKDDRAKGDKMSSPKNSPTLSVAADMARRR